MKDAGILNYRARMMPIDAERIARYGKDVDKGREQVKGAFKFKAPKVEKADGRAGRDADGDGLVNERERPTPARLTPARPVRRSGLGEQPTPMLRASGQVAGGAAVATAAAMVARSLSRSTNTAARVAGGAAYGVSALTGLATASLAGAATANDVMYQRRVEEVGRKYGFTPASRGERVVTEVQRARQSARRGGEL
jgi:hypothetical protein